MVISRDFTNYSRYSFARWLNMQVVIFGNPREAMNDYLRDHSTSGKKLDTGTFGVQFESYRGASKLTRANRKFGKRTSPGLARPRRAFLVGQKIGYETMSRNGFASGPVALLAAGYVASVIEILSRLLTAPLGPKGHLLNDSDRNGVLVALRFASLNLDEITTSALGVQVVGDYKPRLLSAARASYERLKSVKDQLGDRITPRHVYTEFLFDVKTQESRYSWALRTLDAIGCDDRPNIDRMRTGNPYFTSKFVVALNFALAVRDYPDIAVEEAWNLFRAMCQDAWYLLIPEYKTNRAFHNYVCHAYPQAAAKMHEWISEGAGSSLKDDIEKGMRPHSEIKGPAKRASTYKKKQK